MQRAKTTRCAALLILLVALSASVTAQKKSLPRVIWRDPGDMASLNVLDGAGGKGHGPDPNGPFTFVKEDFSMKSESA